ncbi:Inner membrane protein [Salmonella enterica subsp. enterica]|nr:Inner membrane protein [Salmonella enterica subsp. enterica] [Salmonella enterica subsp. enterica serovar Virchow]
MFESKINPLWQSFILAVQEEVKPALGCTEPISLALAAAAAAAELNGTVERIDAWVSPNLMKKWYGRYRSRNGNGRATDRRGVGRVGR